MYFEPNQFENRPDKKLKQNAVPTLFNISNAPKKLLSTRRVLQRKHSQIIRASSPRILINQKRTLPHSDHSYSSTDLDTKPLKKIPKYDHFYVAHDNMSFPSCSSSVLSIESETLPIQPESTEPMSFPRMSTNQSNSKVEMLDKQLVIEKLKKTGDYNGRFQH